MGYASHAAVVIAPSFGEDRWDGAILTIEKPSDHQRHGMHYSVTLIETTGRITTQVFSDTDVEVGRSSSNQVRPDPLTHNQVSRHHGRISREKDGSLVYTDLDSTQGSWMANQRVRGATRLRHGDVITLGKDGPRIHITLDQGRVTGKRGTHLRQHTNSPAFPLALSSNFVTRFQKYARVAVGGFGEIWKTTDRETGKRLAIKLMHPSLLAPDALDEQDRDSLVARFSREARLTHLLTAGNSPSIVPVLDFGDDYQRDFLYIIMEHIEGPSLDRIIQPDNLLSPGKICRYMLDIARGLEAAHKFKWTDETGNSSRGILHRDIKPNNLIIEEKTDRAWICDFGVASIMEGGERLTATNITIGTHHFLPPESLQEGVYNTATDLWGFNMTFFVTFSGGRFPFPLDMGGEVIRTRNYENFTPITTFRIDLPPGLTEALHRSLNKDPEKRVQSATEWIGILEPLAE